MSAEVAGRHLSGAGDENWPAQPGEFCWLQDQSGNQFSCLSFMCPCGCGAEGALTIRGAAGEAEHPSWLWDGDESKPTLTPSILRTRNCGWHGYLTKGIWKSC